MLTNISKRSLMASFFVCALSLSFCVKSSESNSNTLTPLSNSPIWSALLHMNDGRSAIQDDSFILTFDNFSLVNELEATIELLSKDKNQLCNFPARAIWLSQNQLLPEVKFSHCPELSEFLAKVPLDSLHLVFSAENLSQPSSMMGHILLKTQGVNKKGNTEEYGITFFTEINAINLPKTIYDTMVGGSPGFFALSPYQENLEQYLVKEKRNVWEYKLSLSDFEKKLIQLHFWELKSKNIEYFFTDYNCATLTNTVLSLANQELSNQNNWWYTPLDVVKAVHKTSMVESTNVLSSTDWKIRLLSEYLGDVKLETLQELPLLTSNSSQIERRLLQLELVSAINDYKFNEGDIDTNRHRKVEQDISTQMQNMPDFQIQLTDYKTPTKTPNDSKFSLALNRQGNTNRTVFSFIPASHELTDDNRQYFAESELKLGQVSISYDSNDKLKLDEFNLYSMLTLTPYHAITGGLSGGFNIRYKRQLSGLNTEQHFTEIGGQLGITKKIAQDIFAYGLTELQLATDIKTAFFTGSGKLGLLFYNFDNMKTNLEFKRVFNSAGQGLNYSELKWQQSIFLSNSINLKLNHSYIKIEGVSQRNYGLSIEHLF